MTYACASLYIHLSLISRFQGRHQLDAPNDLTPRQKQKRAPTRISPPYSLPGLLDTGHERHRPCDTVRRNPSVHTAAPVQTASGRLPIPRRLFGRPFCRSHGRMRSANSLPELSTLLSGGDVGGSGMPRSLSASSLDQWEAGWSAAYFSWLQTNRQLVMVVWLVVTAAAWLFGQDALSYITTNSEGPPSTPGALAQQALGRHFPHLLYEQALVTVESRDGCDVFNTRVECFVAQLEDGVQGYYLPLFYPPVSLFSVLPPGEEISGSAADVQLQEEVEALRAQGVRVEDEYGEPRLTPAMINATVANAHDVLGANRSARDKEVRCKAAALFPPC